jgi:hypothetical protein
MHHLRQPLFRLLLINLAIGVAVAALMLGGLLALNPENLRDLIFADRSPLTALGLLLFGLIVTLGSTAMGTAIMSLGRRNAPSSFLTAALPGQTARRPRTPDKEIRSRTEPRVRRR